MDATDVISISDSESNTSSIVLLKLPTPNKIKTPPDSDTRRSISQNNEEVEVVTLSSVSQKSTERCPVTWNESAKKTNLRFLNSDTFFTPSPRSKVTHWLSENADRYTSSCSLDQQGSAEPPLNMKESPMESLATFSTNKSSILVRQDYKKSDSSESNFAAKNVIVNNLNTNSRIMYLQNRTERTSESQLFNKFGEHILCNRTDIDNSNLIQNSNQSVAIGNNLQTFDAEQSDVDVEGTVNLTPLSVKSLVKSMPTMCEIQTSVENDSSCKTEARPKITTCTNVPLSPETQKKIELCQYLKLMNMNPSDTRTTGMKQNRRSTRVKHLALMSEKRELERKLNSETQELEKKKSLKISDGDSRCSSDNDRGSKTSKKSNTSTMSSNTSKTPPLNISPSQKAPAEENKNKSNIKPAERRNSVKTPSQFLQVPEVSTTSNSKNKSDLKNSIQTANTNKDQQKREDNFSNAQVPFRKSDGDVNIPKENGSNSSCKSEIITKKSFQQLCITVESLKSLRSMRSQSTDSLNESTNSDKNPTFSFVNSVANIPNTPCDFDDTIKLILPEVVKHVTLPETARGISKQKTLVKKNSDSTKNNKKTKENSPNQKRRFLHKRKAKISADSPKCKIPRLNGKIEKSKTYQTVKKKQPSSKTNRPNTRLAQKLERRKKYVNPKHINRLRSRGRLKQIELKKILLKDKKKKVTKTLRRKIKLQLNLIQEKDFKTTELIQNGSENNSIVTKELNITLKECESVDKIEKPEISPNKDSPSKIKKRLPEAEIWKKYFTSEHRRAYIESIKYLEEEENANKTSNSAKKDISKDTQNNVEVEEEKPKNHDNEDVQVVSPCYGFETTEIKVDELHKINEICVNINSSITPISCANASSSNQSYADKNRPSSEDLEVDKLMSCKRMKDQGTQKDCESPNARCDTLLTDVTDPALAEHSRCTSSSDPPSSANSWSLQTVQSNQDPVTSTSRQDTIEVPCRSPNHSAKIQISETPTCTRKSATPLYQPDDSSSRFSVGQPEVVNISQIEPTTCTYVHLPSNGTEVKSLHHCLTQPKTKLRDKSRNSSPIDRQNWEESFGTDKSPKTDRKTSQSHKIFLSNTNGAVLNAYYVDYNLIIVQELVVSFWNQSPLGNVLGAQDMWIPKGNTRRMVLGNGCVHKESSETVISFDNTVAYIELWTKEHKSDKRERPVADIFIAIYLRLSRNGPDKKVLQLENIHSYASDVQYIVLRNALSIIVSWSVIADGVSSTIVHCYQLSPDYQMVTSITKMQEVGHYVSSLHNIEDCDTLILGCGDYKITLWDLEHGYVVATIDLIEIHPQPRTVWAKRDRGFLFTLHHFSDGVLQLIAINSFDSTWKKLQSYKPEFDYENLLGVCMENGLLVAFYDTGVSCWSVQTGIPVLEDTSEESGVLLPYGKHVVVVLNNQVHVRHALEYLITMCPMEDS